MQVGDTIQEAINLKITGTKVITMSVGTYINTMEVHGIASMPSERNVMTTPSFNSLDVMIDGVVAATCNGMTL